MRARAFLIDSLHIYVLCAFAFAQPLFDIFSRYPEFFSARQSQPIDIWIFVMAVMFAVPTLLVVVEFFCSVIANGARSIVHLTIVGLLAALIVLPALKKLPVGHDWLILISAGLVGLIFVALYLRFSIARQFVSMASVTLVLFPSIFIFSSPMEKIVFANQGELSVHVDIKNRIPIVFVVLDELPIVSLMDEHKRIDPLRYPNLSLLAEDSYWYRNATTVAGATLRSLPALLTGMYPSLERRLAIAVDYPENLFSLLGENYAFNVFEGVTSICPDQLCPERVANLSERLPVLFADATAVFLHIVLPSSLASSLPDVTQNWGGFAAQDDQINGRSSKLENDSPVSVAGRRKIGDRREFFKNFVRSIRHQGKPTLNFLHVELPHGPFTYLESGKAYNGGLWPRSGRPARKRKRWIDEWAMVQQQLQSLLQLGYVDKLMGELIDKLKESTLYDESLIIVVSDHGASYRLGSKRRTLTEQNFMDIMSVLMLVKLPDQRQGFITERNVETIDILPTIFDVLDTDVPLAIDGQSVLDDSSPGRGNKRIYARYATRFFYFAAAIDEKYDTLRRKVRLFGSGADPIVLYGLDVRSDLIGSHVENGGFVEKMNVEVEIDNLDRYLDVDMNGEFVPVKVAGRVHAKRGKKASFDIVVSVNGVIQAAAKTYWWKTGNEFFVMVPEKAFRDGRNDVRVHVIAGTKVKGGGSG